MRTVLFVLLLLLGPPAAALSHAARVPAGGGTGKVFLTVEEALQLAFPECEIARRTVYLTAAQKERAGKLAGFEVERGIVRPYVATRDGVVVGTAYFDAHRVRTKRETLMIVVDRQRRIQRLELLAFAEPVQYVPNGKWYAQFLGRRLDEELSLKRGIRGVTGATLTARATTAAARRTLALHEVIFEAPEPEPENRAPDAPAPDGSVAGSAAGR